MSVLPLKDRRYMEDRGIAFEEVLDGAQRGIVLHDFPLPPSLFDSELADILIILPGGYPDTPPDMFFALPWLKLKADARHPRAADVSFSFAGQNWQRWSRHSKEWRPGVDGIWTMVKRVETALREAA